jgi:hypothetical protein
MIRRFVQKERDARGRGEGDIEFSHPARAVGAILEGRGSLCLYQKLM